MQAAKTYLRTALLWALIPLTVFAARPVGGCLCASGEYKLFCPAKLLGISSGNLDSTNNSACVRTCCALPKHEKPVVEPCCQDKSSRGVTAENCFQSNGNNCCSPDMFAGMTVVPRVSISAAAEQAPLFHVLPAQTAANWNSATSILMLLVDDVGPPGGDLLISLRRFLI